MGFSCIIYEFHHMGSWISDINSNGYFVMPYYNKSRESCIWRYPYVLSYGFQNTYNIDPIHIV